MADTTREPLPALRRVIQIAGFDRFIAAKGYRVSPARASRLHVGG